MNTLTDAVEVARAAAAEIGLDVKFWREGENHMEFRPGGSLAHRALMLGVMAQYGPTKPVRCSNCSNVARGQENTKPNCITVAEALQGITCGR